MLSPTLIAQRRVLHRIEVEDRASELRLWVVLTGASRQGGPARSFDRLALDRHGGLRIGVASERRRALYSHVLGALLHDDDRCFRARPLTLAPLVERLDAALRPGREVLEARLVGVELRGDAPTDCLLVTSGDAHLHLARLDLLDLLPRMQAATLALRLHHREVQIELRPPNLILYDQPREEPAVRAFLCERGLLESPGTR